MTKNVVAKDLRTPKYKQRKVESKKNITERKEKYLVITMTTMERNKFYMKTKDNELAYIAGLFDGEGSIHYKRSPEKKKKHKGEGHRISNSMRISMEITMTDKSVLVWLHQILGVGTLTKKPRKGKRVDGTRYLMQYRWRCTFRDAFYVCCLLFPYAHTKLPKIQKVIDHYTDKNNRVMNDKVVNLQEYKEIMHLE